MRGAGRHRRCTVPRLADAGGARECARECIPARTPTESRLMEVEEKIGYSGVARCEDPASAGAGGRREPTRAAGSGTPIISSASISRLAPSGAVWLSPVVCHRSSVTVGRGGPPCPPVPLASAVALQPGGHGGPPLPDASKSAASSWVSRCLPASAGM